MQNSVFLTGKRGFLAENTIWFCVVKKLKKYLRKIIQQLIKRDFFQHFAF